MMRLGLLTGHSFQESLLVDERNLDDGFPILLLSIEILLELGWVEVQNGRVWVVHEVLSSMHQHAVVTSGRTSTYPVS